MNIVGIVGCRNYNDYGEFSKKINEWVGVNGKIDIIVSGGCNGVDKLAEIYSKENNISMKIFNADWKTYGKRAGPIRNKQIVDAVNHLIALPSKNSKGTYITIKMADEKKIPITEIKI